MVIIEIGRVFVFKMVIIFCNFILIYCRIIEVNFGGIWIILNVNNSIFVFGIVFGNVYIVLYRNGNILDLYFWFNDFKYCWIVYDNWVYIRILEGLNNIFFFYYI